MIGQTISHYKILEKLGEGGMGVVYKAEDLKLKRTVALKFLPHPLTASEPEQARFLQEAQAAATLNHPNVCTIYALEEDNNRQFIVMEYVDGVTARQKFQEAPLKLSDAISYAIEIGEALQEAHSKGVIHRDIKSDNIMVNLKNQIKVMDFGLAKLKGALKLTRTSSTVSTLAYMAPEQVQGGEVDARSDIFSFGVVLYEMLTGRTPFRGEHEAAMMYSILNEEPEPVQKYRPELSSEFLHILNRALEKDPSDRYQSVKEMVIDLRRLKKESTKVSRQSLGEIKIHGAPEALHGLHISKKTIWVSLGVIAVLSIIALYVFLPPKAVSVGRKSIAVLPFKNMNNDKESEYFSDGITEDIITQLSKIAELKVISSPSIMRYKNTDKGVRDIGKELNVATILVGSIRRVGNKVRVGAQLIDAISDEQFWAETYDKELTEIFAIQSDVAKQIATTLKAKLSPAEKERIEKKPTENLTAYDYYLKGRDYYYRYRKQDNENAIELFKKALELDPNYALAYAGLGDAYGQRPAKFGFPDVWVDSSIAAANKALSLDQNLAEAYKALGLAYVGKGWNKRSLEAHSKAAELNPNYYPAVGNIGYIYLSMGNFDEALRWLKKSVALNPTFAYNYAGVGIIYVSLDDDAKAEQWLNKALELQPDFSFARSGLSIMYLKQGKFHEAMEQSRKILANDPNDLLGLNRAGLVELLQGNYAQTKQYYEKAIAIDSTRGSTTGLGYIYWKTGKQDEARNLFTQSLRRDHNQLDKGNESSGIPYDIAAINANQGNKEEAYKWLQKAIDAGWRFYDFGLIDPLLENLRNDDQFQQMMAQVKAKVDEMRKRVEQAEKE